LCAKRIQKDNVERNKLNEVIDHQGSHKLLMAKKKQV
jgi:hypothetical protein